MKKIKKGLIIIIIALILIITFVVIRTVIAAVAQTYDFQWSSLKSRQEDINKHSEYSTVFCLAHNYHLSTGKTKYQFWKTININGDKASTSNSTKPTNNIYNAKLAYIFYNAVGKDLSSVGAEDSDEDQNAIWKFWPTWWNKNAKDLGINSRNLKLWHENCTE